MNRQNYGPCQYAIMSLNVSPGKLNICCWYPGLARTGAGRTRALQFSSTCLTFTGRTTHCLPLGTAFAIINLNYSDLILYLVDYDATQYSFLPITFCSLWILRSRGGIQSQIMSIRCKESIVLVWTIVFSYCSKKTKKAGYTKINAAVHV
jgi:hypothetical protein